MKLDKIYNDLIEIIKNDMDFQKALKLKESLEKAIREETCYKTTSKTRIDAIKRVASHTDVRPALTGYGQFTFEGKDYNIVTDSYHLIAVNRNQDMPLKLVTTDNDLANKVGHQNVICGNYPQLNGIFSGLSTYTDTIKLDFDDVATFHKLHSKRAKEELYTLKSLSGNIQLNVNINYLKNVIDVLGKDLTVYVKDEIHPVWFVNSDNELGLVLPVKTY